MTEISKGSPGDEADKAGADLGHTHQGLHCRFSCRRSAAYYNPAPPHVLSHFNPSST